MIFTNAEAVKNQAEANMGFNPLIQVNDFYEKILQLQGRRKPCVRFNPLIKVNDFYCF